MSYFCMIKYSFDKTDGLMVNNKQRLTMRKGTLLLVLLLAFVSLNAQNNKMKIAVMDFKAGVGVNQAEIEGLSDMLINTLFQTGKFEIIERTQIDQARKELKFQETEPTYEQIAQMGRFLGVESVLIGTVNKLFDEYNVDVRAINVESAKVVTTAGRSLDKKTASAFRKMMEKLGKELANNLIEDTFVVDKEEKPMIKTSNFRQSGFTLRPEVGMNIPIVAEQRFLFSPSVELAVGYQVGPHFFFGIVGGYGGRKRVYTYNNSNNNYYPLTADIRYYLIDHKYSFIIDIRGGVGIDDTYVLTLFSGNIGFAIGNYEVTTGVCFNPERSDYCLLFNLAYRFGNVIKKWW